jgi:CheY-like chemotaxis protein
MIVDDDEDLRQTLVELVEAWGYAACSARNGKEALSKLTEVAPSLVLLDLMMPEVDGWAFVEAVTKRDVNLNIVVITASHPDDVPAGYPVLHKPMALAEVKRAIEWSMHV